MSRRVSKGKKINPTFFIFCEGETEESYIKYLRSTYRLPIEIDPKISGGTITGKYISSYMKQKTVHPKDKTFLMYDCDVEAVLKGTFDDKLRDKMIANKIKAISKAKRFEEFANPSTNIYKLIEDLDAIKQLSV